MDGALAIVAGATILTVVGILFGGTFLLKIATGRRRFNSLQQAFFRAGHAHAGVLVILGLTCLLVQDSVDVPAPWEWAGAGVLASAILIPSGFFLSVLGENPVAPTRLISLLWAGVGILAISLVLVGASVIVAGVSRLS